MPVSAHVLIDCCPSNASRTDSGNDEQIKISDWYGSREKSRRNIEDTTLDVPWNTYSCTISSSRKTDTLLCEERHNLLMILNLVTHSRADLEVAGYFSNYPFRRCVDTIACYFFVVPINGSLKLAEPTAIHSSTCVFVRGASRSRLSAIEWCR